MCGIAGCVGRECAINFVTDGLGLMEERGYDSAGVAYLGAEAPRLEVFRAVGSIANLLAILPESSTEATAAIGHTRWATHGAKTKNNAHPQTNMDGTIAVVHNGVIENFDSIKRELLAEGHEFSSETDTEVVPQLLDHYIKQGLEPDEAFDTAIKRLEGAFAILGYFGVEPDSIYAARQGSNPLIMGQRRDEWFVASMEDPILSATRWTTPLENREMARMSSDNSRYRVWHFDGQTVTRPHTEILRKVEIADKGEFEHWMLKEIYDGPNTVRDAIRGRVSPEEGTVRLGGLELPEIQERLIATDRIIIVACGTSYHAGLVGERLIEEIAGLPVEVHLASEFQYRNEPLGRDTAVIGISQSGETADTIGALHKAKQNHLLALGINNSPGSEMEKITDAGVHCRAGKERSVASTKAFISQVTVLCEIAIKLAKESTPETDALITELGGLPEKMEQVLANRKEIEALAKKYAHFNNFLYLGRGYEHVSAMEGALKLKEISYVHAEAYSAGEMKHGPLALIDENFPTFAIATNSPVYEKTLSNISEIKSRNGPVIALATEGNSEIFAKADDVIYVPASLEQTQPIINAVAMQLFAYYVSVERGLADELDRPRNLAKYVTVE